MVEVGKYDKFAFKISRRKFQSWLSFSNFQPGVKLFYVSSPLAGLNGSSSVKLVFVLLDLEKLTAGTPNLTVIFMYI